MHASLGVLLFLGKKDQSKPILRSSDFYQCHSLCRLGGLDLRWLVDRMTHLAMLPLLQLNAGVAESILLCQLPPGLFGDLQWVLLLLYKFYYSHFYGRNRLRDYQALLFLQSNPQLFQRVALYCFHCRAT